MSNDHAAEKGKWELKKKKKKKKKKQKEEKWVKHYSSNHQILLVGEGDFSFSLSLARSLGSASNILASSLDSYDVLIKTYKEAKSNLQNLEEMGASLLHRVDATIMKFHTDLTMRKFDRIVFNFPHAGFHGKEDNAHMIKMHRDLLNGFFWNASCMLLADGEIHVSHKTTAPFCYWNIQELASYNSMALVECLDFKKEDYPGYENKRGSGSRCDEAFPLGECSTFKFKFYRTTEKLLGRTHLTSSITGICQQFQETLIQMQQCSTSTYFSYPQEGHLSNMEQISGRAPLPLPTNLRNQFLGMPPLLLPTNPRNQFFGMPRWPLETDPRNQLHWMPPLPLPTDPRNQFLGMPPLPLPTDPRNQFFGIPPSPLPLPTDPRNQFHWMPPLPLPTDPRNQFLGMLPLPLPTDPINQFLGMPPSPLPLPTDPRNQFHWIPPLPLPTDPRNQFLGMPPSQLPLPTDPRNQFFGMPPSPLETNPRNQFHWMIDGPLNHPTEMFGRGNYNISSSLDTPGIHPVPGEWE